MPTTIPLVPRDPDAELVLTEHAHWRTPDLVAVIVFSAIGFALTIGIALVFPLAPSAVALSETVR